jgi:hypothetical protein
MRSVVALLAFTCSLALSTAVRAEEEPAPGGGMAAGDPATRLRRALEALAAQPTAAFTGSVEIKEGGMDAMMRMSRGMMGGGDTSEPFKGSFEAYQGEGRTVIASTTRVPGFAILTGARGLTRVLYRTTPPDVGTLSREVPHLLDRAALARALGAVDWKTAEGPGGAVRMTGAVEEKLLPEDANVAMLMMLGGAGDPAAAGGIDAEVDLSAEGTIGQIRLRVRRPNTAKLVMDMAKKMGVGGEQMPGLPAEGDGGQSPETTYTIRPAGTTPSETMKSTIEEMDALAARK